ncbi:hypothetical protein SDC9_69332 [bioreactor metagenome]|uniref:Uncharacterized protein n=1 Tax=bioreactor metagenome TaxID=1076179 RepID=A0A644Y2V0_9ZZZZ
MPPAFQNLLPVGQFLFFHAVDTAFFGFKVNDKKGVEKVEKRGNYRRQSDGGIGNARHLRHNKGRGAHHRGHDLSALRCRYLDGRRHMGLKAELFHEGDGNGAGGDNVGDGAAGHGAHERAADHRGFRRTAVISSEQAVAKVHHYVGRAGALKARAKQDKHEQIGGRHRQAQPKNALLRKGCEINQPSKAQSRVIQRPAEIVSEHAVRNADQGEDEKRQACPPGHFQHHDYQHRRNGNLRHAQLVCRKQRQHGAVVKYDVSCADKNSPDKNPVNRPCQMGKTAVFKFQRLAYREENKAHYNQKQCPVYNGRLIWPKDRCVEHICREQNCRAANNPLQPRAFAGGHLSARRFLVSDQLLQPPLLRVWSIGHFFFHNVLPPFNFASAFINKLYNLMFCLSI